ncbi:MAG: DUF5995 family protein [Aggregatilineales bacterium]
MITQATTINEVIAALDDIIAEARRHRSRLGFFAALYRRVTVTVKAGIAAHQFEDGARMEQFDVAFANRYLEAYHSYRNKERPTNAWLIAFEATRNRNLVLLQHLLLGMNAHINLDLGIAAAQVAPGDAIDSLYEDFKQINLILASLVNEVVHEFSQIWPFIGWCDRQLRGREDSVIDIEMRIVRDQAWILAQQLARLDPDSRTTEIAKIDERVASLGHRIRNPGFLVGFVLMIFQRTDFRSIDATIKILDEKMKQQAKTAARG